MCGRKKIICTRLHCSKYVRDHYSKFSIHLPSQIISGVISSSLADNMEWIELGGLRENRHGNVFSVGTLYIACIDYSVHWRSDLRELRAIVWISMHLVLNLPLKINHIHRSMHVAAFTCQVFDVVNHVECLHILSHVLWGLSMYSHTPPWLIVVPWEAILVDLGWIISVCLIIRLHIQTEAPRNVLIRLSTHNYHAINSCLAP